MKAPSLKKLTLCAALALASAVPSVAQTAAPKPAPATTTDTDEIFVLSPFTVDASKDTGYQATSTLAGSRVNTSLKDVGASITVVTKAMLTDLSAVNVNDILSYTANTEGFHEYTNSPAGVAGRTTDAASQTPNNANRVRGLSYADNLRDYYYTINATGLDTYNIDEVTLNRGPNSVLAGLGTPSGIINYAPQSALLSKNSGALSFRFGSWGDKRATLNANYVAIPKTLAFRVAIAANDVGYKQKPSFNRDTRMYLAATYQPWKKTTIRANFERVDLHANRPNTITASDEVSNWIAAGKPIYDSSISGANPALTPDPRLLWAWAAPNLLIVRDKSGKLETAYNASSQRVVASAISGLVTPMGLNSNKYLPLDSINTQPSNEKNRYTSFSLSIDQEIVENLNVNLGYVHEAYNSNYLSLFRPDNNSLYVDSNKYLPNGTTNPHLGEMYMDFRGLDNSQFDWNTNDIFRGTVTYKLDLTKINPWLGSLRFTGFGEQRDSKFHHEQFTSFGTNAAGNFGEANFRYYLGGNLLGNTVAPATAAPGAFGLLKGVSQLYNNGTSWTTTNLDTNYYRKADSRFRRKLGSEAAIVQGNFLKDRIVAMYGIRRDKDQEGVNKTNLDPTSPTQFAPLASEDIALTTKSNTTKSVSVVVHPLPIDWISFHYSRSENWVPHGSAIDLLGHATPSPTGKGKDYGFSLDLLKNKLHVKFNWYDMTAANDSDAIAESVNMPLAQWAIPFMDLYKMPGIAAYHGVTNYKKGIADGITLGDSRLYNGYTANTTSKGMEVEMTYNITDNWRLMVNVSKQEAKISNVATGLTAFIEERLAYWKSIPGLWDTWVLPAAADPNHTIDPWWSTDRTGRDIWGAWGYEGEYLTYKAWEGKPSPQLAKYHGSLMTNYDFTRGPMKGLNLGFGTRYIDKTIIGAPGIFDSTGTIVTGLDTNHPYYYHSYLTYDAWLGYKFRPAFFGKKYELSFQLNCRNIESKGRYQPIKADYYGVARDFRIVQPRSFYVTTELRF
jgi:outer membrane receptor protein involved in Fe transport